jgi:hypothetical protein
VQQALQQEFQALQKQDVRNGLSERVCIGLLLKLIDTNQVSLYYTLSGKEYITPAQLERYQSHTLSHHFLSITLSTYNDTLPR